MTKPKDDSNLSDEEKHKGLMFHHIKAISAQDAIVAAATKERTRLRKLARGDGLVLADIDFAIRCSTLEDPSIVPAELLRKIEIASWYALPVNFQPSMFADREPLVDRAFREGERDGLSGKDASSNPYGMDSAAGQSHLDGWKKGQAQLAAAMKSEMESNIIKRQKDQPVPETTEEPKAETIPEADAKPPETSDDEWQKAAPKLPPKPKSKKADAAVH